MHYIKVVLLQTKSVAPRRMCGVMHYPGWVFVYEPALLGILELNLPQMSPGQEVVYIIWNTS